MERLKDIFDFSTTLKHPLARRGLVEMVPASWADSLRNPKAGDFTDLSPFTGEKVPLDELWKNMKTNGMRDPLILSVGRVDGLSRLEAGNHRIGLFIAKNVPFVPATVLVGDGCVVCEENGKHSYEIPLLLDLKSEDLRPYDERAYAKPSSVFVYIADLKNKGFLPDVHVFTL